MSTSAISPTDRKAIQNASNNDQLTKALKQAAADLQASKGSAATVGDLKDELDQLLSKDKDKKDAVDSVLGKVDQKTALSSNPFG